MKRIAFLKGNPRCFTIQIAHRPNAKCITFSTRSKELFQARTWKPVIKKITKNTLYKLKSCLDDAVIRNQKSLKH